MFRVNYSLHIFVRVGRQHSARPFRMGLFQHEAQPLRANLPPLFLFLGFVDSTRFAVEQVAASTFRYSDIAGSLRFRKGKKHGFSRKRRLNLNPISLKINDAFDRA